MLFEKVQLEPGEEVLKVVRRHWFILAIEFASVFFMILLPFLIMLLLTVTSHLLPSFTLELSEHMSLIVFGLAAWILLALMTGFTIWTHYFLDLWIVTDRRIIVVDQIRFFARNVSIFRLERLQDIEFTISGLIPTLLNYGTIQAQTAGAHESNFKTTGLPDPRELQALIQQAMDTRLRVLHINPDSLE